MLKSAPGATEMSSPEDALVANRLEPIEIFLEQPDGSKVRISFLASGEIEGVPQIMPETYELVSNAEENSSSLALKDSDVHTTFVSPEGSQHISTIQTPDGQIYYFESNPPLKTEKDGLGEAPIFYTLLPKELFSSTDCEPASLKQWTEDELSKEDTKDNVYSNARERLKPFVTVHKARRRMESTITQIGGDLHLEAKMAARAALLPAPVRGYRGSGPRVGQNNKCNGKCSLCEEKCAECGEKSSDKSGDKCNDNCNDKSGDKSNKKCSKCGGKCSKCSEKCDKSAYRCDMCDASFSRAAQFYGHSKAHTGERRLRCQLCTDNKVFAAHAQLLQHERACHVSVRSHVCNSCSATFERPSQLANHRRSFHLKERPNLCGVCGKAFFKRSDLRSHLNIHLGLDVHVCPTCGRRFSHVSNLNRHLRTHTGVRPFPCATCGRRFAQASGLALHVETHATSRSVACSVEACASHFLSRAAQRAHMRDRHADIPADDKDSSTVPRSRRFHCRVCGENFPFATLLRSHENSHVEQNTFPCTWCGLHLSNMDALKSHPCRNLGQREQDSERDVLVERLLDSEVEDSPSSQDIVIYITQEQDVDLNQDLTSSDLTSHGKVNITLQSEVPITSQADHEVLLADSDWPALLKQEAEDSAGRCVDGEVKEEIISVVKIPLRDFSLNRPRICCPSEETTPEEGTTQNSVKMEIPPIIEAPPTCKTFRCTAPGCAKTFLKSGNFKQHLGTHYAGARLHLCPTCGESFAWRSTLRKHLSNHDPIEERQRYPCSVCTKTYLLPAQVQIHMRRDHMNERPHTCSLCDKVFFKKHDLTVHLRTHTKETPYMCATCGRQFSHASHAARHAAQHDGLRPHSCQACGRCFAQAGSLRVHVRRQACRPAKEISGQ